MEPRIWEVTIIEYSERGMKRVMFAASVKVDGKFLFLNRDEVVVDRPYAGDLFESAEEAKLYFSDMGHSVQIAPSQGAAIHGAIR